MRPHWSVNARCKHLNKHSRINSTVSHQERIWVFFLKKKTYLKPLAIRVRSGQSLESCGMHGVDLLSSGLHPDGKVFEATHFTRLTRPFQAHRRRISCCPSPRCLMSAASFHLGFLCPCVFISCQGNTRFLLLPVWCLDRYCSRQVCLEI